MKIQIIGENTAARTLREHLESLGYKLANFGASYAVRLSEDNSPRVKIESKESNFAIEALNKLKELAQVPVDLDRSASGSAREIHILFGSDASSAVVFGVLRALLNLTGHGAPAASEAKAIPGASWIKKIFGQETK